MVHSLVLYKPPASKHVQWPPWPHPCRVVRNNPEAVRKMLASPKARLVALLPTEARFPEIVAWRTTLPRSGGPLVIRPTGAGGARVKTWSPDGLVVGHGTNNGAPASGRAVLYKDGFVTCLAFLDLPKDDSTPQTVTNVPENFRILNASKQTSAPSHAIVMVGNHKAAVVPLLPNTLRLAVLRYEKTLAARYALRDNLGRKIFEAGPNRYHLPPNGTIYCAFDLETQTWSAVRAVLLPQPLTDARCIDSWSHPDTLAQWAALVDELKRGNFFSAGPPTARWATAQPKVAVSTSSSTRTPT